ncbi:stonustoxin subunit alpha-like [Sinocyclocheilus rhinocerous]|uniref:stonustoxin subunit alpha-like n=1 Tax=Sinocyclocheilus rhinocerous TaxID=307959 RepID=UPI0007BAC050|nr:PREDICTED: stonustoxin subunit alpha-like [Sinocyclocheilus rhinocerous]
MEDLLLRIFSCRRDTPEFSWLSRTVEDTLYRHYTVHCRVVLDVSLFLCSGACDLTLDPNTANTRLMLSDENRRITHDYEHQPYPDHPERFDDVPQVLCVESLTGRCYWEAEWSGDNADISVSYKGISRKGVREGCMFGWNDKSWSLDCSDDRFTVWHNNNRTDIPVVCSSSNRVGVYLDVSAGSLSFYSVSDTHTVTHLHTLKTTFTEPLCAGFTVYYDSSLSLCDIKR